MTAGSAPQAQNPIPSEPPIPTAFHDPMKDWPNDDLLLDPKERAHFCQRRPRLAPIFYWPELRAVFGTHEKPANDARDKSRRYGFIAVAFGFAGLSLSALAPVLARLHSGSDPVPALRWLGAFSAALTVIGGVVGFHQILAGRQKQRWLMNRYWTERIRQFHFQLILNNLAEAAAAMRDSAALSAWRELRQRELDGFLHDASRNLLTTFDRLEDDRAEESVWVDRAWSKEPPTPAETPELAELLDGLRALRIGVQERYSHEKLHTGIFSPKTRWGWLLGISDGLTFAILLLTIAIGAAYFFGFYDKVTNQSKWWFLLLLGLSGTLTAAVVALRVLNEGLLLRTETERYEWYLASVRSIDRRFESANMAERVELLRELERLAYQELRRFLIAFQKARFVM